MNLIVIRCKETIKSIEMKNYRKQRMPFMSKKCLPQKEEENTHFDSLQSLLSAYLTSVLLSSSTCGPLFCVCGTTVAEQTWKWNLRPVFASTPFPVGAECNGVASRRIHCFPKTKTDKHKELGFSFVGQWHRKRQRL